MSTYQHLYDVLVQAGVDVEEINADSVQFYTYLDDVNGTNAVYHMNKHCGWSSNRGWSTVQGTAVSGSLFDVSRTNLCKCTMQQMGTPSWGVQGGYFAQELTVQNGNGWSLFLAMVFLITGHHDDVLSRLNARIDKGQVPAASSRAKALKDSEVMLRDYQSLLKKHAAWSNKAPSAYRALLDAEDRIINLRAKVEQYGKNAKVSTSEKAKAELKLRESMLPRKWQHGLPPVDATPLLVGVSGIRVFEHNQTIRQLSSLYVVRKTSAQTLFAMPRFVYEYILQSGSSSVLYNRYCQAIEQPKDMSAADIAALWDVTSGGLFDLHEVIKTLRALDS